MLNFFQNILHNLFDCFSSHTHENKCSRDLKNVYKNFSRKLISKVSVNVESA